MSFCETVATFSLDGFVPGLSTASPLPLRAKEAQTLGVVGNFQTGEKFPSVKIFLANPRATHPPPPPCSSPGNPVPEVTTAPLPLVPSVPEQRKIRGTRGADRGVRCPPLPQRRCARPDVALRRPVGQSGLGGFPTPSPPDQWAIPTSRVGCAEAPLDNATPPLAAGCTSAIGAQGWWWHLPAA